MHLDLESLQYNLKQRAFRLRVIAISSWTRITPKAKTGALLSALYETACSLLTFSIFTSNYPEETRTVFLGRAATAGTYQCLWNSKWKPIRWKGLMTFAPAISFPEHVLQWCPLVLETPQKIWLWTIVPKTTQMTPPKTKFYTGRTQVQNAAISLISCTGTAAVRAKMENPISFKDGEFNLFQRWRIQSLSKMENPVSFSSWTDCSARCRLGSCHHHMNAEY